MSVFLYYIPGQKPTRETLKKLGLEYLVGKGNPDARGVNKGPDGKPGYIFLPDTTLVKEKIPARGYWEEKQEWHDFGEYWIGIDKNLKPGPEGMIRAGVGELRGYQVELGDEREWFIPVARLLDGSTPLPKRLVWKDENWQEGEVVAKYTELFNHALKFADQLLTTEFSEVTFEYTANVATLALSFIYRIGPAEISVLELLNTHNEYDIILSIIDYPRVLELAKKKRADIEQCSTSGKKE